jgi:hypothetical protein
MLHIAKVVPMVVTPSHVALVLMVAALAKLIANETERTYLNKRTYLNIGFLLTGRSSP